MMDKIKLRPMSEIPKEVNEILALEKFGFCLLRRLYCKDTGKFVKWLRPGGNDAPSLDWFYGWLPADPDAYELPGGLQQCK